MKKLLIVISVCMFVLLAGCSAPTTSGSQTSSPSTSSSKPLDLTGEWKQTNSDSSTSYQSATISGDTIEVYWVSDGGNTKSLYWAGTYSAPKDAAKDYSWDSTNDKSKTESALLASPDDTKKFTYSDGVLSYSASAMGTTTTIKLSRQ